ncbi:MAG TPA: hypothetical protein VNB64_13710, partial [Solirubrobacteraceae bacterium]|nr:hypothetical protein [Solirubrobacteraceae bacterium]
MSARKLLAPVLLGLALAVPASAAGQARVLGSPLTNPPNVALGCETRPALGDDGGTGTYYPTPSNQPDCTWRQTGVIGVTDYNQDPRTSSVPATGRIVNIRVRSGPNPALIRFVILRQLSCSGTTCNQGGDGGVPGGTGGTYCCYFVEEGPVVRPNAPGPGNPNGITDFATNFFVARNVDSNGVLAADHVAVSGVSGTGSLPLHSTGRNNFFQSTQPGSVNASFWYPRMGALGSDRGPMGGAGRREDGMPGMEILLQWTWCPAGQTCAPPAQPVPPTTTPAGTAPALSGLGVAPSRFRTRGRAPTGTRVRFNLSTPASVTFGVERALAGRRLA